MYVYVVMLHHTMDDVPLRAFSGKSGDDAKNARKTAREFAAKQGPEVHPDIAKTLGVQCTTPCSISVVEFAYGVPVSKEIIKDFGDNS